MTGVREGLLLLGALAVGWWAHGEQRVHAANVTVSDFQFQLQPGDSASNSLLIYSPGDNAIYVYKGATTGNSHMQCSYRFLISKGGQSVERQNCDMGSLTR
ncbi:MAG TPA: hypothetical protein VGD64_16820 [Acidisarcina sp.]